MLRQLLLSDFGTDGPASGHGWGLVQAEFPTVAVGPLAAGRGSRVLRLDVSEWGSLDFDPFTWDARVFGAAESSEQLALHLEGARGEALVIAALEILTRYQGLVGRRNEASSIRLFDRLLARHRALHDLHLPLVRADYQHALDAWQWALRLRPDADLAVQAAALFHDVERLLSESERRVEHHAPDYQAFKDAHAARGAELTCQVLEEVGADTATCQRVRNLVARHERPDGDADLALINDADALSFFSLNASGFVRYFDPEHSRRKVAYTLARLRPEQLRRLGQMRLAPAVRVLLDAQLSTLPLPGGEA
jgi:predicted metal-dependent HD superfamily phosphohydrolase